MTTTENKMKGVIEATKHEFGAVRTGRANPALLERVVVDYYGTPTPLTQMAGVSAPDARMLLVQPWDKTQLGNIERAILKADLGLNPTNDGTVIRLAIPVLTEERRKELVKVIHKVAEEKRVAIRNVRRDANEQLKKLEKDKDSGLSEDDIKKALDDMQKLTNKYIAEIDHLVEVKEKEIMEL